MVAQRSDATTSRGNQGLAGQFHMPGPSVIDRIRSEYRRRGFWKTARFLAGRVWRRWDSVVYDALPSALSDGELWQGGEHLQVIGPDEIDTVLTPELAAFLGGEAAAENLDGVRRGDRLFVVSNGSEFLHCGYIMFRTRQCNLIGESGAPPPLIGCCRTAPTAQGRGLYRRALRAELHFLNQQGYKRAVIETAPENAPSRKGIEAAGFQFCRRATSWVFVNKLVFQRAEEPRGVRWRLFIV